MSTHRYKNRAHQSAYNAGYQAAADGRERKPPYDVSKSVYFRRAWLRGYDERAIGASAPAGHQ